MNRLFVSSAAASALLAACSPADPDTAERSGNDDKVAAVPASLGKQTFDKWCADCHAPGPRHPGTASLQARDNGDVPAALEERNDLTPEVVEYFVRHGVMIMPPFRKTEITDAELAALGAYLSHQPEPAVTPTGR